jgi:hypothetical protein
MNDGSHDHPAAWTGAAAHGAGDDNDDGDDVIGYEAALPFLWVDGPRADAAATPWAPSAG